MGLAVVNYQEPGRGGTAWGILQEGGIRPLATAYSSHREVMAHYFSDAAGFQSGISQRAVPAGAVKFESPVSADIQLFCQGLNYADHRVESGASTARDEENLLFMKAASSICAPNETILRPTGCQLLDYEIELGLVMKRDVDGPTDIHAANLSEYVGGLVIANDVSARDFMFGSPMLQWFRGKSQRTFCPMGPVLYLMDEPDFDKLYSLQLELKLNGDVKQSASTDLLIHKPAQTLAELSGFASFRAGDCLLTGTPGGVLAGTNLKVALAVVLNLKNDKRRREKFTRAQLGQGRFLEPGDELELTIRTADGSIDLGTQRNTIADV